MVRERDESLEGRERERERVLRKEYVRLMLFQVDNYQKQLPASFMGSD